MEQSKTSPTEDKTAENIQTSEPNKEDKLSFLFTGNRDSTQQIRELLICILLWDVIGNPRRREELESGSLKRRRHSVDFLDLEFLQNFNTLANKAPGFRLQLPHSFGTLVFVKTSGDLLGDRNCLFLS